MKEYNLDPDTLKEHLPDLNFRLNKENIFNQVSTKVRSALTRQYNKLNKGSVVRKKKKKKVAKQNIEQFDPTKHETKNEVEEDSSDQEEQDVIKAIKKRKRGKKKKKTRRRKN